MSSLHLPQKAERYQRPCLRSNPNTPCAPPILRPRSPPSLLKLHHFPPGDPFLFPTHSWIIAVSCRLLPAALPNLRLRVTEARWDWNHLVLRLVKSKSRHPSQSRINDSWADFGEQGSEIKPQLQLPSRHTTGFWWIQRRNSSNISAIVRGVRDLSGDSLPGMTDLCIFLPIRRKKSSIPLLLTQSRTFPGGDEHGAT